MNEFHLFVFIINNRKTAGARAGVVKGAEDEQKKKRCSFCNKNKRYANLL